MICWRGCEPWGASPCPRRPITAEPRRSLPTGPVRAAGSAADRVPGHRQILVRGVRDGTAPPVVFADSPAGTVTEAFRYEGRSPVRHQKVHRRNRLAVPGVIDPTTPAVVRDGARVGAVVDGVAGDRAKFAVVDPQYHGRLPC